MSDASVRTIGHDDEASLWTTTSHSTIGIDHLKQKGPQWYDIDKRRCGEFGPFMTSSPHNPFMTNGRQRPPTSEKSTATVYPSGPLSDAVVFDSLMTPALKPRDPAMAGVGRCSKAVIAAPPDLRDDAETRRDADHPDEPPFTNIAAVLARRLQVDCSGRGFAGEARAAPGPRRRVDLPQGLGAQRPLGAAADARVAADDAGGARVEPTTPAAPGSRPTTPGSRPATPGNRIVRDIP